MSDGSRKQPMQARLSATGKGAPPSSAAGGAAAAALAASLSAFSAASASRTSLVAAPRSGCCACSLTSNGLKPRSGSATRRPRTASSRASGVQGSPMRGQPPGKAAPLRVSPSAPVARPRHQQRRYGIRATHTAGAEGSALHTALPCRHPPPALRLLARGVGKFELRVNDGTVAATNNHGRATARRRHQAATWANWAFTAGAGDSAAARSQCTTASLSSAAERGPICQAPSAAPLSTTARIMLGGTSFGAARTTLADSALSSSSFHHSGLATSAHCSCRSFARSPPDSAPSPRGTAARPPRSAPSCRALHRGSCTRGARRASGRWPRGRSCLLCASPALRRTASPPPAARRTRRPSARRRGCHAPRPRDSAAAPAHHPLASSASSSPSCETPRAAPTRQGSPGSPCRRGTSSAASHRGTIADRMLFTLVVHV
eukprot:scaffold56166_cov64-Phaeocystis_antarctica.AAC.3